jgi:ribonuclease J
MIRNMGLAIDLGYLKVPDGLVVDQKTIDRLPARQVTLVCTGSQGEPMAVLARMATGTHSIRVGAGDTVLLASSLIPGNENAIYRVINALTALGANVVHKGNAKVHVSGHASAGELVYCYNIVQPSTVLPVHGEARHLRANAELATRTGVEPDRVLIAGNGDVVDLHHGRATVTGTVEVHNIYVDGQTVGSATEATLAQRRALGTEGVLTVVALIDPDTGRLAEEPDIIVRGFEHDPDDFGPLTPALEKALTGAAERNITDLDALEDIIARETGKWVRKAFGRQPVIIPVVIDA